MQNHCMTYSDFTWIYWIHLNTCSRESTLDRSRCPDQRRHVGRTGRLAWGKLLEEEKNPKFKDVQSVFFFDRMSKGNVEDARASCSSTRSFRVFMRELDLRWTDRFDHFYWDELWVFPKIKSTTKWMTSNLQIVVGSAIILWQLQDKITSLQPSSIFFWSTRSHGNHNVDMVINDL